ncbi:MAG: heparinase II/III family protein [Lentisphaerae bacterium]|nr:heparinase II/III family protein [Lentisphaerota bacterium]
MSLPDMGLMASVRKLGGDRVKLLLLGNKAGAGHAHEDKGSFVLEFAGETFAMDPGICDYANALVHALKSCERHNMLVPSGLPEQARPANPIPRDVKPAGQGDERSFQARMDLAAGWEPYYKTWARSWESPAPDRLTIRDEYELLRGNAVEFYWQTQQTVAVQGCTVILTGRRGVVEIEFPADGTIRVEELPLAGDHPQRRIAFRREGTRGSIVVQVRLRIGVSIF